MDSTMSHYPPISYMLCSRLLSNQTQNACVNRGISFEDTKFTSLLLCSRVNHNGGRSNCASSEVNIRNSNTELVPDICVKDV